MTLSLRKSCQRPPSQPAVPMPAAATARKKKTRNIAAAKVVEEHRALLDGLTVPQIAALQSTFLSFSTEVPGFINAKQLGPLLRELGDDPSAEELGELISLVDASGNGLVDLEEFSALLAIRTQHKHTPSDVREALKVSRLAAAGQLSVVVLSWRMPPSQRRCAGGHSPGGLRCSRGGARPLAEQARLGSLCGPLSARRPAVRLAPCRSQSRPLPGCPRRSCSM